MVYLYIYILYSILFYYYTMVDTFEKESLYSYYNFILLLNKYINVNTSTNTNNTINNITNIIPDEHNTIDELVYILDKESLSNIEVLYSNLKKRLKFLIIEHTNKHSSKILSDLYSKLFKEEIILSDYHLISTNFLQLKAAFNKDYTNITSITLDEENSTPNTTNNPNIIDTTDITTNNPNTADTTTTNLTNTTTTNNTKSLDLSKLKLFSKYTDIESLQKSYSTYNRLYIYEYFLVLMTHYYTKYSTSYFILLQDKKNNLILTEPYKYYLGIMSSSVYKCDYLKTLLENSFISTGGEASWLVFGLNIVHQKIKRLDLLNNILINEPWILKCDIINDILYKDKDKSNKNTNNKSDYWANLPEFVYAVLVLIYYHKISMLCNVLNIKINNVLEDTTSNTNNTPENDQEISLSHKELRQNKLSNLKKNLNEVEELSFSSKGSMNNNKNNDSLSFLQISEFNPEEIQKIVKIKSIYKDDTERFYKHISADADEKTHYSNSSSTFQIFDNKKYDYTSYFDFDFYDEGVPILENILNESQVVQTIVEEMKENNVIYY